MSELLQESYRYAVENQGEFRFALLQHVRLVAVALGISILLCVPLGIWTARSRTAAMAIINVVNGLRVIPSLAVLFLAIPYFGLSFTAAAVALTLLALPPVLINTDAAYRTIEPAIRQNAVGPILLCPTGGRQPRESFASASLPPQANSQVQSDQHGAVLGWAPPLPWTCHPLSNFCDGLQTNRQAQQHPGLAG